MSSVRIRENTFKLCLKNFSKRPTYEEIHAFVHDKVGLQPTQVTRLQMNHSQNCVHVKCVDLKTAQDAVINHNDRHEMVVDKKRIKVRLMMDDAGVEIKIHDLSENVRNEEVAAYLKQYGTVLSVRDVVWGDNFKYKGINTGVKIAKMVLRRHIKSFVTILGEQTMVSYRTQPQTCRHCHNQLHPGSSCVENKKLLMQKQDLNKRLDLARTQDGAGSNNQNGAGSSWANVVSNAEDAAVSLLPQFTNLTQLHVQPQNLSATEDGVEPISSISADQSIPASTEGDENPGETPMEQSENEAITQTTNQAIEQLTNVTIEQSAMELDAANGEMESAAEVNDENPNALTSPDEHQGSTAASGDTAISSSSVSDPLFKHPLPLPNLDPLLMQISDSEATNDTAESSVEGGESSFQQVKRKKRGRPKKIKLVD